MSTKEEKAMEVVRLVNEWTNADPGIEARQIAVKMQDLAKEIINSLEVSHLAVNAANALPAFYLEKDLKKAAVIIEKETRCGEMRALLQQWHDRRFAAKETFPEPFFATKKLLEETKP